jgi:prophage DNA circulation protein
MRLISSVKGFLNSANARADQLTAIAKGALCLPSILSNLPDLGKSVMGNILASANSILSDATAAISGIVTDTIDNAIAKITGSIAGVLNTITGLVAEVAGAIESIKSFAEGLSSKVSDIKDFTASKENCNFAAASLLNCIASQALANVSAKAAVDVSKGLVPIDEFANSISESILSPAGAINNTINKTANEIDRATRMVSKADLF